MGSVWVRPAGRGPGTRARLAHSRGDDRYDADRAHAFAQRAPQGPGLAAADPAGDDASPAAPRGRLRDRDRGNRRADPRLACLPRRHHAALQGVRLPGRRGRRRRHRRARARHPRLTARVVDLQFLLSAPLRHLHRRSRRGRGGPVCVPWAVDSDLRAARPRHRAGRGRRDPRAGAAHPADAQRRAGRAGPRTPLLPGHPVAAARPVRLCGRRPVRARPRAWPAARAGLGGRASGLLLLRGDRPPLDRAERRVLRAFCDQFALVLERDRLLEAATEAEAYRRTEHIRRSLLAAVSHDLRSPLAAIKASVTDLLGHDVQHSADEARDALDSIDKETDRLGALIANLLDMSRIEGGMLKARPRNLDLAEILAPCVDRLQRQRPRLCMRLDVEGGECVVRADPMFLDRVVANLLDNAAKAAADSGNHQIEVHAERADGQTTVRIVDHGNGVPHSVREQLFYPFYQLSERHPRLGTGLGLAISKGFLTLMHGQIWVEETPGGGATFAFSLPTGTTAR